MSVKLHRTGVNGTEIGCSQALNPRHANVVIEGTGPSISRFDGRMCGWEGRLLVEFVYGWVGYWLSCWLLGGWIVGWEGGLWEGWIVAGIDGWMGGVLLGGLVDGTGVLVCRRLDGWTG